MVQESKVKADKILQIRSDFKKFGKILFMLLSFYLLISYNEEFISNKIGPRALNKPYKTFQEFYPFYISQHADPICKILHFVGTSIIFNILAFNINSLLNFIPAYLIGNSMRILTINSDHGIYEGLAMIITFLYISKLLSHSISKGCLILLVGYGFAWVGHYFFEKNSPATFIYPTYSLMGDFYLWYQIAVGTIKLSF